MNRITRHFTALLLALTSGLHGTVLRSVAGMPMLGNDSADASFGEAVVRTLDGKHRCKLCIAVDEGKRSEREWQQLKSPAKADWMITASALLLVRPTSPIAPVPACLPLPSFGTGPSLATSPAGLSQLLTSAPRRSTWSPPVSADSWKVLRTEPRLALSENQTSANLVGTPPTLANP